MKKKEKLFRIILAGFIWWALFYPDLYLVEDDCCVVECESSINEDSEEDLVKQICVAKPCEIVFKSRLLEWLKDCGIRR